MPWQGPLAWSAVALIGMTVTGCGKEAGTGSSSTAASSSAQLAPSGGPAAGSGAPATKPGATDVPAAKPAAGAGAACRTTDVRQALVVGKLGAVPIVTFASAASPLVGVGFVSEPTKAIGFALAPGTLQPRVSFTKSTTAKIRSVVPYPSGESIAFAVDEDDPKAMQQSPRTIGADPPVTIRSFKKALTIATGMDASPEVGWLLPAEVPVVALAGGAVPGKGTAVVARTEDALRIGWMDPAGKPVGSLHDVADAGKAGPALSVGANVEGALVLFRPGDTDETKPVRMTRAPFGAAPSKPASWEAPPGGPGARWSLPSAFGLADGRWVLVWVEGDKDDKQLRMQTYDAALHAVGEPVVASKGKNVVEGAAVVGPAGGVLVVRSTDGGYDRVTALGLDCS